MRTLHIDTEKTWRGGEQQALYLVSGLLEQGHVAEVVCQPGSVFADRAAAAGARVHTLRMRGDVDLFGVAGIASVLTAGRFEIVHMHTSRAHMLGCLAARITGRARTVVSRRVDFTSRQKGTLFSGLKYRFGVDRYIAISRAIRDILLHEGVHPGRVRVVNSGINPDRLTAQGTDPRAAFGIPREAPVVGCVAHFADHKGHRFLLDAAPNLLRAHPELRFLLVGKGELMEALQQQAHRLGIADRVIFPGFRTDVTDCFLAMDIVAAPSTLEGLNTSILDALYLRRPVVASNTGGIPEIVHPGETGLLVPPCEPRPLGEAISELLRDPDRAARLGEAGRALVLRGFTHQTMVRGTIETYADVLRNRGVHAA